MKYISEYGQVFNSLEDVVSRELNEVFDTTYEGELESMRRKIELLENLVRLLVVDRIKDIDDLNTVFGDALTPDNYKEVEDDVPF